MSGNNTKRYQCFGPLWDLWHNLSWIVGCSNITHYNSQLFSLAPGKNLARYPRSRFCFGV